MAVKLSVKLQSPTIELIVKAQDASGAKDTIKVGFKRYEVKEAKAKLDELSEILSNAPQDMVDVPEIDNFIKKEVVYILQANLELEDTDTKTNKTLLVQDTRTVKPNESLWGDASECLVVLLDLYLSSAPWRLSLLLAAQKALLNNDYSVAEIKN